MARSKKALRAKAITRVMPGSALSEGLITCAEMLVVRVMQDWRDFHLVRRLEQVGRRRNQLSQVVHWERGGGPHRAVPGLKAAGDEAASREPVPLLHGQLSRRDELVVDVGAKAVTQPNLRVAGRRPVQALSRLPDMATTDPIAVAAKAFVARSLGVLRDRCPAEGDKDFEGFQSWVEDTEHEHSIVRFGDFKTFRVMPKLSDPTIVCAWRELAQMRADGIAEYRELVEVLADDPIIGPRLGNDTVGGAGMGGGACQPEMITEALVIKLIEESGGLDPSPEVVEQTVDAWLADLRRERETMIVLAPLADLVGAGSPIQVKTGVEIDELTSDEIAAALMFGTETVTEFAQNPGFGMGRIPLTVEVPPTFAVRASYTAPVVRGGGTPEQVNETVAAQQDALRVAEEVLLTLRLLKPGRVGLRAIVTVKSQPDGLWPSSRYLPERGRRMRGDPYVLTVDEGIDLAQLYRQLASSRSSSRLIDAAARRFADAAGRSRPDDEIVDLVIAAESLFLGDVGSPKDRGEIAYRFATRAASFTDGTNRERRQVLAFTRNAYRARSGIVHSGRLDEAKLRGLNGQPTSAGEFADEFEEFVRQALRKAVARVPLGLSWPPDWDELLFRDETD
jgi:Apea-like HEPN